jgi:hypothetical protein
VRWRGAAFLAGFAGLLAPVACNGGAVRPGGGEDTRNEASMGAEAMRIEIEMDGGLAYMPGLARPVTIPLDQVPEAEAREIRELVVSTHFFELPARAGAPLTRGADRRSYTLTITEGTRCHVVTVTEPIEDEALRRLVRLVEAQARGARRRAATGQPP